MNGDKVHLLDLRLRTSAAGNQYLSGWLGKAAVVGFLDREQEGEVWNIFVSTPTKPGEGPAAAKRRHQSNGYPPCNPAISTTASTTFERTGHGQQSTN